MGYNFSKSVSLIAQWVIECANKIEETLNLELDIEDSFEMASIIMKYIENNKNIIIRDLENSFGIEDITKENLVNIVCRWMDYHNSDESYITETSNGKKFINGGYQTDLRSFINNIIKLNISYSEAVSKAKE